ncbi:tyrosine-type recombinase/integrase [Brevundimonas sp.]|uniref:tyrosine-type recombinase/integrase n=1 Tax=Brevundimonas sp. TaxID=1871086 RepID=UPI002D37BDDA|nr:integrase arm-type DNA-binding domain-containing protein [Brevundimonas sp.]HYC98482.1 integrase arm-type DNA-binding domain-containing protein [Brevundimonas sp.]
MARVFLTDSAVKAAKAEPGKRLELSDTGTPWLWLRVTDAGVKSWVLRYRNAKGEARRFKFGDAATMSLKAARQRAASLKADIDNGADPAAAKRQVRAEAQSLTIRTVGDLLDAYEKACASGEWKPKKKKKRASTIAYEKRLTDRHIRPVIGKLAVVDVKRATVKALLRGMIDAGIGAQTNRVHAIIRQAFNFAIAEELLPVNPAMGFDTFHDSKPRQRIWTDAELKAVWPVLREPTNLKDAEGEPVYVGRPVAIALQLCALLLQRRSEVAGMALSELDLDGAAWLIPGERMKADKPHRVPLPPHALSLIREAIALAALRTNEPLTVVFPSPSDVHSAITADSLTHALAKLRPVAGIEGVTVHDLRRTGSTLMTGERLGVSPFIRSKVLGHGSDAGGGASVSMLHYDANEYLTEKRRALEAWENLLLEIVGERERASNVTPMREAAH